MLGRAGARPNSIDPNSQKRIFARPGARPNSIDPNSQKRIFARVIHKSLNLLFFLPIAFLLLFASSGCSDYTFSDADDDRKPRYVVYQGGDCNSGGFNITAGTLPVDNTKYIRTQMPVLKTPPICSGSGTSKTFSFWQVTDSGSDGEHPPGASVPFHRYTKTLTATAMWNCFRETYNLNGGSGTIVPTCKNPNDSYSLSNVTPTKAKYKFKGWLKQGTTTTLQPSAAAGNASSNATTPMPTFIAQWERVISGLQIVGTTNIPGFMEKGDTLTLKAQIADPTDGSEANHEIQWTADGCTVSPTTSTGHHNVNSATAVTLTLNTNGICTLTAKAADGGTAGNNPASAERKIDVSEFKIGDEMKTAVPVELPADGSGIKFPTGDDDNGTEGAIKHKFEIGKTEVTYELWRKVYDWATDSARGTNVYKFANAGQMGSESSGTGMTPQHPVTDINWRDSIVWCNAFTEWYNATKGASLSVVYKKGTAILRDATLKSDSTNFDVDGLTMPIDGKFTATGFRLPTSAEWEFAARWAGAKSGTCPTNTIEKTGNCFTKGNSASGATLPAPTRETTLPNDKSWSDLRDEAVRVAVWANSWWNGSIYASMDSVSSAFVGSKAPNALQLYDMSGNVGEWCFDSVVGSNKRKIGGADYKDTAYSLLIGRSSSGVEPDYGVSSFYLKNGLRFVRTMP